jgi:hypothetical protein
MTTNRFLAVAFLLAIIAFPVASATASPAATAPGGHRDWNGEIDKVVIIKPFRADSYRDIFVRALEPRPCYLKVRAND